MKINQPERSKFSQTFSVRFDSVDWFSRLISFNFKVDLIFLVYFEVFFTHLKSKSRRRKLRSMLTQKKNEQISVAKFRFGRSSAQVQSADGNLSGSQILSSGFMQLIKIPNLTARARKKPNEWIARVNWNETSHQHCLTPYITRYLNLFVSFAIVARIDDQMVHACWWYYFSKFTEFFDTVSLSHSGLRWRTILNFFVFFSELADLLRDAQKDEPSVDTSCHSSRGHADVR